MLYERQVQRLCKVSRVSLFLCAAAAAMVAFQVDAVISIALMLVVTVLNGFALVVHNEIDSLDAAARLRSVTEMPSSLNVPSGMRAVFVPRNLDDEYVQLLKEAGQELADAYREERGFDRIAMELKKLQIVRNEKANRDPDDDPPHQAA